MYPSTEETAEEALRGLFKGWTSIVIARRLSTAEHASRILVVDPTANCGKRLARGTGGQARLLQARSTGNGTGGREPGREARKRRPNPALVLSA
ncbi:MAG: hypothetical protein ABIQ34_00210 [Tepidiformaceae bacterium]